MQERLDAVQNLLQSLRERARASLGQRGEMRSPTLENEDVPGPER